MRAPAKARLLPALVAGPGVLLLLGLAVALGPIGAALAVAGIVAGELWSGAAWLGLRLGRRALRRSWGAVAAGRLTLGIGAAGLAARWPGLRLPGGPDDGALWADVLAVEGPPIAGALLLGALVGAGAAAALGHGRAALGWVLPLGLGIAGVGARVGAGGPAAATPAQVEEGGGAALRAGPPPPGVGDWIEICAGPGGERPVAFARSPGRALRPARGGAGAELVELAGLTAVACGPPGAAHAVARGDRAVWLHDAATLAPLRRLDHAGPGLPGALAVLPDGAVIVADDQDGSLRRYAPGAPTGARPAAEHRLPSPVVGLRVAGQGEPVLAITGGAGGRAALPIDPGSLRPLGPGLPLSEGPVAAGAGWLWDLHPDGGARGRAWPAGDGEARRVELGRVHALAVDEEGRLWALDRAAGRLSRLDPGASAVAGGPRVGAAARIAAPPGSVYVVSHTGLIQITGGAPAGGADRPRSAAGTATP